MTMWLVSRQQKTSGTGCWGELPTPYVYCCKVPQLYANGKTGVLYQLFQPTKCYEVDQVSSFTYRVEIHLTDAEDH